MNFTASIVLRIAPALAAGAIALGASVAASAGIRVVASIKPVHSLVSAVMAGVGEPRLLIRGRASPHIFTLRPSDAAALADADVVFLIGETLETSIARAIETLARKARVVALADSEGLVRRPLRGGGAFEPVPPREPAEDRAKGDSRGRPDPDRGRPGRGRGVFDMHVWLDPVNGGTMARAIAHALSQADPANAARYEANARTLLPRLDALAKQVSTELAPVRAKPFVVFHDGYRYFEDRFGLNAVGSVVVSPERSPGAKRLRRLRAKMRELDVACVFAEPQFNKRIVDVVLEGSKTRSGVIDPLGTDIEDGPELYFTLLRNMAAAFKGCLATGV
ncbi:MAG: zinc ABC transporter substrate-binding protein [Defluviicoccus sp.]|nr:zinc ABC transporter substrate-binding protein [Defluviicoccus sp.]